MYNSIAYIIYLLCSLIVVIWVGRILHRNGKLFLEETCPDKDLADNTNNLLICGYCLMNSGFAFYKFNSLDTLKNFTDVIEFVASSEGFILITLGIMHFLNMLIVPKIIMFFADTNKLITNPSDDKKKSDTKSNHHEL